MQIDTSDLLAIFEELAETLPYTSENLTEDKELIISSIDETTARFEDLDEDEEVIKIETIFKPIYKDSFEYMDKIWIVENVSFNSGTYKAFAFSNEKAKF